MKLVINVVIIIIGAMGFVAQAAYQNEIGIVYSVDEYSPSNDKLTTAGLLGRHFFGVVDDDKGPHLEAAFLDPESSLALAYINIDGEDGTDSANNLDIKGYLVNGRWITANKKIELELEYTQFKASPGSSKGKFTALTLGYYVQANAEVSIEFGKTSYTDSIFDTADLIGISYENLLSLNNKQFIKFELEYSEETDTFSIPIPKETTKIVELSADYYFSRSTGLGVSYDKYSDAIEQKVLGIRISHYFNPRIELIVGFETTDAKITVDDDSDKFDLSLTYRL
ncbi:MAG: putative porin [Thiohalomonadales bacterium]